VNEICLNKPLLTAHAALSLDDRSDMMASNPKPEIVDKIDIGKAGPARYRTAIGPDGKKVRIRMIDPNSPTFTADLLSSFRANVRRARAENRALGLDV
jgi:hypothetical protein